MNIQRKIKNSYTINDNETETTSENRECLNIQNNNNNNTLLLCLVTVNTNHITNPIEWSTSRKLLAPQIPINPMTFMKRWSSFAVLLRPTAIFRSEPHKCNPRLKLYLFMIHCTIIIPSMPGSPKRIMSIRFSEFSYISYVSCVPCLINLILREPIILILFDERAWLRNSHYGIFSSVLSFLWHRFYTFYSPPSSQGKSINVLLQGERPCLRNPKSTRTVMYPWACILILKFECRRGGRQKIMFWK